MIRRIILTCLLSVSLPSMALSQTFGAEEFTLENGLQVVVIPNHRAPVVTQMLWVKAGAADRKEGQSGMAHYLEHLLFKGTKTMAPGMYSKTIRTMGGNDNAFTSQDYTAFYETVSKDNLPKIMAMEADRMVNIDPPEEHYKSEKAVVLEERRQRTDNDPTAIFSEQIDSALFANHPYGSPVIGWMDEIERYQWKDVKTFYDTWYAPNNIILVISGDITAKELKPLAEKYYAPLPQKIIPLRTRPSVPPGNGMTTITLHAPTIQQSEIDIEFIAPAENKNRKDALSLQIFAEIMDGGPTTRLYKTLVVEQKKAISVSFNYNSTALDYGTISLSATPADGVSLEYLDSLLRKQLKYVLETGVTENELKDAVQRLRDQAVYARDSVQGPAMIFGAALATGSSVSDVENWSNDLETITLDDIKAAVQTYMDEDKPWIRPPVTGYIFAKTDKDNRAEQEKPAKGKPHVQR